MNAKGGFTMATITLQYDARRKEAKELISMIESSGLFLILKDETPNETTVHAIKEAKEGKTYKARNFQDMVKYLNA